jgi:Swi5-dependent recombination DNA repair protein 1
MTSYIALVDKLATLVCFCINVNLRMFTAMDLYLTSDSTDITKMSTPAAKRRRIEAAASTLSKPFRSPFKSPLKSPSSLDSTRPITPATDETSSFVLSEWTPSILVSPAVTPHPTLGRHKKTLSPSASIATQLNTDPDIAVLLRAQRELEKQLREVKEQLETAEQARKIERESRKTSVEGEIDGELIGLIEKWRGASRQAAEELFGKVRDRVNR